MAMLEITPAMMAASLEMVPVTLAAASLEMSEALARWHRGDVGSGVAGTWVGQGKPYGSPLATFERPYRANDGVRRGVNDNDDDDVGRALVTASLGGVSHGVGNGVVEDVGGSVGWTVCGRALASPSVTLVTASVAAAMT